MGGGRGGGVGGVVGWWADRVGSGAVGSEGASAVKVAARCGGGGGAIARACPGTFNAEEESVAASLNEGRQAC